MNIDFKKQKGDKMKMLNKIFKKPIYKNKIIIMFPILKANMSSYTLKIFNKVCLFSDIAK